MLLDTRARLATVEDELDLQRTETVSLDAFAEILCGTTSLMTTSSDPQSITVRLRYAMNAANGLTNADILNVGSLIEVGECLVAFETLCTQIYERDIAVSVPIIQDLESLGLILGASRDLTDHIWEDVARA